MDREPSLPCIVSACSLIVHSVVNPVCKVKVRRDLVKTLLFDTQYRVDWHNNVRVYCARLRLSFIYVATFIGTGEPSAARYAAILPQNTANEMSCNVLKTKTFPPTSINQNHSLFQFSPPILSQHYPTISPQ